MHRLPIVPCRLRWDGAGLHFSGQCAALGTQGWGVAVNTVKIKQLVQQCPPKCHITRHTIDKILSKNRPLNNRLKLLFPNVLVYGDKLS